MAESRAFEWTCEQLERDSALDRLEARGTVRLSLKQAGLDARTVTVSELAVVIDRILPSELQARGIEQAETICRALTLGLKSQAGLAQEGSDSPEAIFKRLGR